MEVWFDFFSIFIHNPWFYMEYVFIFLLYLQKIVWALRKRNQRRKQHSLSHCLQSTPVYHCISETLIALSMQMHFIIGLQEPQEEK